jgi:hypothetical protein
MKSLYDEDGNILLQDLLIRSKVRKTSGRNFAKNHTSMSMTEGRNRRGGKGAFAFKGFSRLFIALSCSSCHVFLRLARKCFW